MSRAEVGVFLRSLDNDYQQRLREDALATGRKLGLKVTIVAAQNDPARQQAQIAETIRAPKAGSLLAVLVSAVRDDLLADLARSAAETGVAWGLLNREAPYLENLRADVPGVPVFAVTPDQHEIGRIQAEQIKGALPQGGTVLCVTGPTKTSSAVQRLEGLQAGLRQVRTFAVAPVEADWTTEGARLATDRWIEALPPSERLPEIIAAQNDEMARGVRQALRDAALRRGEAALAETPITGCDGSPAFGQRLVKEKRIWATVQVPSASGPALESVARWRKDGNHPPLHLKLSVASFPDLGKLARSRA